MRKATSLFPLRLVASVLGLVTASIACLCAGALLAVRYQGVPRVVIAGAGFVAYLYFLAHALRGVNLPDVIVETRPDPERRRKEFPEPANVVVRRPEAGRNRRDHRFAA